MKSYQGERGFGLVVGGVFVALASWWLFRGKFQAVAPWVLAIGALMVVSGLIFPRLLVLPNRFWMTLAEVLSFRMTRLILAIVFFLLVTPLGLFRRASGGDSLNRRAERSDSYWKAYGARQADHRHYEKMY
jgi:Saxitoxin biosynthesis operon protein SxtJ